MKMLRKHLASLSQELSVVASNVSLLSVLKKTSPEWDRARVRKDEGGKSPPSPPPSHFAVNAFSPKGKDGDHNYIMPEDKRKRRDMKGGVNSCPAWGGEGVAFRRGLHQGIPSRRSRPHAHV